jgi:predicted aldo/keto reductase-like oxidoreductase
MTIFDNINPFGIGTGRLPINSLKDFKGVERSAEIIADALNLGAYYVDVAYSYSRGLAQAACKLAFEATDAPRGVTLKVSFDADKTAEAALRRAEVSLKNMGLNHAAYFVVWGIRSYDEFLQIIRKGSLYDGALKAKEQGLVDHICFSSHAKPDELVKIIESGLFEGATISFSAINSVVMLPVVESAIKSGVGLAVMNPLGGGIITQNEDYFAFLKSGSGETLPQAALRFIKAHNGIQVVLSGLNSKRELHENMKALESKGDISDEARLAQVGKRFRSLTGFCTGCRYCDGCPVGIPIHAYMRANNATLFGPTPAYNRSEPELLINIQLFKTLYQDFKILPESADNPCVKCGRCLDKCTQRLDIPQTLERIFRDAQMCCFTEQSRRERLEILLNGKYKKVAFYPAAGYTLDVLRLYRRFFGQPRFELCFFDSNERLWSTESDGVKINPPSDIPKIRPDIILITSFNYSDEIYDSICHYAELGIEIRKLHTDSDAPWTF